MSDNRPNQILKGNVIDGCYVIVVNDDVEDDQLKLLCEDTITFINDAEMRGVVINFSNMHIIDTYYMELMFNMTKVVSLLGPVVMWTGMRPGVISSIIDLGLETKHISVGESVEACIEKINKG
jgi:rsbT co-antagonist protein RsbR